MSRANAAFSLPPGDRDDADVATSGTLDERAAVAGREPVTPAQVGSPPPLTPASDAVAATLATVLDGATFALGELRLALAHADAPAADAAAWRLSEALMMDPRGLAANLRKTVMRERFVPPASEGASR